MLNNMKKILLYLGLALAIASMSACGTTYYGGGGYSHHHVIVVHHYHTPIVVHHYLTTHVVHHTIVHHSTSNYSRPRVNLTKSYTSRSRH